MPNDPNVTIRFDGDASGLAKAAKQANTHIESVTNKAVSTTAKAGVDQSSVRIRDVAGVDKSVVAQQRAEAAAWQAERNAARKARGSSGWVPDALPTGGMKGVDVQPPRKIGPPRLPFAEIQLPKADIAKPVNLKEAVDHVRKLVPGGQQAAHAFGELGEKARTFSALAGSGSMMAMAGGVMAFGAAAIAAEKGVEFLIGSVEKAVKAGAGLQLQMWKTGAAGKELVILGRVFDQAGLGGGGMTQMLFMMEKALGGVNDMGEDTTSAFAALGLSVESLRNMDPAVALRLVMETIGKLPDQANRAAVAMKIFSRSGKDAAGIFNNQHAFKNAEEDVGGLANTLPDAAENMHELERSFSLMRAKVTELGVVFAKELNPQLQSFATWLRELDATEIGGVIVELVKQAYSLKGVLFGVITPSAIPRLLGEALDRTTGKTPEPEKHEGDKHTANEESKKRASLQAAQILRDNKKINDSVTKALENQATAQGRLVEQARSVLSLTEQRKQLQEDMTKLRTELPKVMQDVYGPDVSSKTLAASAALMPNSKEKVALLEVINKLSEKELEIQRANAALAKEVTASKKEAADQQAADRERTTAQTKQEADQKHAQGIGRRELDLAALQARGLSKEAEAEQKIIDILNEKVRLKELLKLSDSEAQAVAEKLVTDKETAKKRDEANNRAPNVVASSMAEIGGGGRVYAGADQTVNILSSSLTVLQGILNNTKGGILRVSTVG